MPTPLETRAITHLQKFLALVLRHLPEHEPQTIAYLRAAMSDVNSALCVREFESFCKAFLISGDLYSKALSHFQQCHHLPEFKSYKEEVFQVTSKILSQKSEEARLVGIFAKMAVVPVPLAMGGPCGGEPADDEMSDDTGPAL